MSGVDDRVVSMDFQNSRFERGVSTTISSLAKLKDSLNFSGSKKGLDELQASGSRFNLSGMSTSITGVSGKLLAMGTIGVTALANITNRAVNAGLTLAKSLTIAPITQGFHEYETQLNAVQTILANTASEGAKIGDVNKALNTLNTYSDKTIYNFSEMAKNIGTFTAAGVDLKTSVASIKGIANIAALSGSTSEQASTAMYQLSQAIAANKVGLQDWNSVVNAGMGGKAFQEALFNTGKNLKTIKGVDIHTTFDQWTKAGNSFRGSLQSGWLTGKVLTQTLNTFTGDLSDAQLKAMGYSKDQILQIQQMAKNASDAATKVKTLSQLIDTTKEAIGSGWTQTWQILFGNFDEAKATFTGMSQSINKFVNASATARNKVLGDWKALGGRAVLLQSISQIFEALGAVLIPIKEAFREFFPAKTGRDLYNMTVGFKNFLDEITVGVKTSENIKRTFAGLFAVVDIGRQILRGIINVFGTLLGTIFTGSGSITAFTANIGDFLVALDQSLKKGGQINDFFNKLADILAVPLAILIEVAKAVYGLFDGFNQDDATGMSDSVSRIGQRLDGLNSSMGRVVDFFQKVKAKIQPGIDSIEKAFNKIGEVIANAFSEAQFSGILDVVNTGLLAGLALLIRKFLKNGLKLDFSGGLVDSIKGTFDGLTATMKSMQTQLKANTLEKIAIAIGVLTASVLVLSLIDSAKLSKALAAMAVGFGELLAAMALLTKISGSAGFAKVPIIASSLILLSTAVLILTFALRNLSGLDWGQLAKGLAGLAGILLLLSIAAKPLSANSSGMITAGIGITALAVALNIMYLAVLAFSTLNTKAMIKGLAGVAGALVAVALAARLMPKGMVATGAGLLEISIALNALYLAIKLFSTLNWTEMGKGLVGIGAGLIVIAGVMHLMPKGMVLQAAALDLIAVALLGIGKAVGNMGSLNWTQIGKGLGTMAATLLILAGALHLMQSTLSGAASLALAAVGITLLSNAIQKLSGMSWKNIAKGLGVLAGALGILVLAGLGAETVIPGLLVLGVAALGLGAGLALAGIGIGALANGLAALAKSGAQGIAVLLKAFQTFIAQIPTVATALAVGFVNVLKKIGENGPAITAAFIVIIGSVLTAITVNIPKFGLLMTTLITTMLAVLLTNGPRIIAAGLTLLIQLLQGVSNNMPKVTALVADIIVKFLTALAAKMPTIVTAGLTLLVQFLLGISRNVGRVAGAVGSIITSFINAVSSNVGRIVTAGANAIISFVSGLGRNASRIVAAGVTAIISFISGLGTQGVKIANAAGKTILDFLRGLQGAIRTYEPQIISAMFGVGVAMIEGIIDGLGDIAGQITKKITGGLGGVVNNVKNFLHVGVPSKLFADEIGSTIPLGIALGIDQEAHVVNKSAVNMVDGLVNTMGKSLSGVPDMLAGIINLDPTISPVLDLTNLQKTATQIPKILAPGVISPTVSRNQAVSAATSITAGSQSPVEKATNATPTGPTTVEFNQTNISPKTLSAVEIYRNTKNQLSLAKEALKIS